MIVVTGATGALNGATVEHLLQRIPADRIGVSVRDVAKARHFAERGVRVRQGSYDDPVALRASLVDAEQVLLVSSNDMAADVVGQHRTAVEAAVVTGARRILYTSQQGAVGSAYPPAAIHAATEAMLADSGVAWTALRNGFFGSLEQLLGPWQRTGVIAMPADGPIPWTDRADLAEAAAVILTGTRRFDGPVTLAAPAVTLDDFAKIVSGLTGRTIERVVVADEQWVTEQIADGVPEFVAQLTLAMFQAARGGSFAGHHPLLAELLGREPRDAAAQVASQIAS
ncbi:NAD(P)-dependent oxidoreductase [Actinosynnema sp. ALI-1.44]|uniref:NmrA family NAD(P)-binding protein n=1 Tax=Actinosynnema sp. ALI-1.44 TaxID=1933779 RepID=UPI00097BE9DF|nr:NAD(P)H-binding protein [Actinosynnema sp. ALI-1.44]ONI74752.1 NAD(P)-dependent oxidoreductase [Actinosynnema sp. ALI-1.44]